jgi:hypothetical protein
MRETRKFKAGKHDVEVKTYLTERENRELVKVLSSNFKIEEGKVEAKQADTDTVLAYQDKLIEIWVVSVDEKTENFAEGMLDWIKEDYKKVIDEITAIGEDEQKKTK